MKSRIKWNNYIYSVNKWAVYLNTAYPALKNKIKVSLTNHACERIHIQYGSPKKLKHINNLERLDYFYYTNPNENFEILAESILDKSKLDYEDYREIDDLTWYRNIYIKDTKTTVAYERFGVNKSDNIYCHLGLNHKSAPYITDPELVKFAQEDLEIRAVPLITKNKELSKQINLSQKQIDKYRNLIKTHQSKIKEINTTIENIKYQLSNKPPK